MSQHRREQDRAADHQKDQDMGGSLLADTEELWLFTGRRALRFQFQRVHVIDREHGCRDEPRQSHYRADFDEDRENEQIQMIAASFLNANGTF